MGFFSQLSRGATRFFGKQLPRFGQQMGRQLSSVARDVSYGLGKAHNVVNKIEKYTNNIPILGQAVRTLDSGIQTGQALSGATSSLTRGDVRGAYNQGRQAYNLGRNTLTQGVGVATQIAPFI